MCVKYKTNIVYLKENTLNIRKKGLQSCIISIYSKDISTFNELVIKNTHVKGKTNFHFYGKVSPVSGTNLIMRRQNLSLQSTFPIKLYHNSNFLINFNFILST